ncbi:MAG: GAF domain-containing protein [Anaerolineae bacterium]|nr:GAF domain-containing protein [Anaerolineae bacterium]
MNDAASLNQRLQAMSSEVRAVADLLRAQREALRQYNMSLPPGVIGSLKVVHGDLQILAQSAQDPGSELAQLRALADTTALINSTLNIDEVLNRVMDTVIALTGAERVYIALREEGSGEMTFRVARNLDRETLNESEFIVSRTVVQQVAASGEPVLTDNAREDARFSGQESVVGFSLRSILCVPLKARGEVIGVAYADNRIRAGLFSGRELALLSAFADQAAVAIQNARLFARVRASLAEITELKDLLDNVFTSIASGVITTDAEDVITLCNPAARAILNLEEGRSTGMRLEEVLPLGRRWRGCCGRCGRKGGGRRWRWSRRCRRAG